MGVWDEWRVVLIGTGFQFGKMRKVLEMDGDDIVQQCECIQCHRTAHLKTGKVNFNVIYILPIRGGQNSFFFYPSRILGPWKVNS